MPIAPKAKGPLKSWNAWTDWISIALTVAIAVLSIFHVVPNLEASATLGADIQNTIELVKTGQWFALAAAAVKLYNTISHLVKKR